MSKYLDENGLSTLWTKIKNTFVQKTQEATSSVLGLVKVGSNISLSSGTISLSAANVKSALGTDTYSGSGNTDAIVKRAFQPWGSTLKVRMHTSGHFLVTIDNDTMYVGWIAGNPVGVNFTKVNPESGGATASASISGNDITITCSGEHSICCWYCNGVKQ